MRLTGHTQVSCALVSPTTIRRFGAFGTAHSTPTHTARIPTTLTTMLLLRLTAGGCSMHRIRKVDNVSHVSGLLWSTVPHRTAAVEHCHCRRPQHALHPQRPPPPAAQCAAALPGRRWPAPSRRRRRQMRHPPGRGPAAAPGPTARRLAPPCKITATVVGLLGTRFGAGRGGLAEDPRQPPVPTVRPRAPPCGSRCV